MKKTWTIAPPSTDGAQAARRWNVAPLVAQILLQRGLSPDQSCADFLSPSLRSLHSPSLLSGAIRAAELIVQAVRGKKKIVLYGDYDVDGVTGVAILWRMLVHAGADVSFHVPHRVEEGYGLNLETIRKLAADGAEMIVSVDCGITACEVANQLRDAGVSLIITDHHVPPATLPKADAIVHPAIGGYPNPELCGAGTAFKLAWAIAQCLCGQEKVREDFRELLMELLPLAALGTIADVVSLLGENRVIAKNGLAALPKTRIAGLRALVEQAGLAGSEVSCYDVGFKLAPRINAAGRMGHARLAVELLTRATAERAREIALYLDDHNRQRQAAERQITKSACDMVDQGDLASDARRAIVLAADDWHPGVIGVAASRVLERYHRPTVLIALSNGEGQGSARSVRHFDLAAALSECGEYLIAHGGHGMAAGLRIARDNVGAFVDAFVRLANRRLTGSDLVPKLRLDGEVDLHDLDLPSVEVLSSLGPFGIGNPRPRFASGWLELAEEPSCVGKSGEHLRACFRQNGATMRAIGFGMGSMIEDLKEQRRCRAAFEPIINSFNGRRTVEMQLFDIDVGCATQGLNPKEE